MSESPSPLLTFLQDKLCLIVEPSQSFAYAIQTTLQQMGVPHSQLYVARRIQDAKRIIVEKKPKILITEYQIDGLFSMDLIELQGKQYELPERISFINTMNDSDSAVAEASEGEVDGYLLKPFAMNVFQQKLELILTQKMDPSQYLIKINAGKKLYAKEEFSKAIEEFVEAKPMNPKPTLACYHAGQSYQAMGNLEKALAEYQEGRIHQPLHYRCLIGEFEALISAKRYTDAYELIGPLQKNYPITSKRLGHFFIAAVFANQLADLPGFYKLFNRLDQRTPELIKISAMAMLTAGRIFLKEKNLDKALEYFDIGLMISNKDFEFLEKVVAEFIKIDAGTHAQSLFIKASSTDVGKLHYSLLEFKVGEFTLPNEKIIEKGRKLVDDGHGTSEIYAAVVKAMAKLGKEILAGTFIAKIAAIHPTEAPKLYKILEDNLLRKVEKKP